MIYDSQRAKSEFRTGIHMASLLLMGIAATVSAQAGRWSYLPDTAAVTPREECSFSHAGGKFYLLGGRGRPAVQEYNPPTKTWKSLKTAPTTFNHFQALSHCGLIYVIGAFDESSSGYPNETPAPNVYIYDPLSDTWVKGPAIPAARLRGSAGLVEYKNRFYVVLGNRRGHYGPGAPYLDEFDPATNAWTPLPDAPRFRDHFQAAVANGKLYAMGGRQSINANAVFTDLEKVDVYDFAKGSWSTLPSPESDLKVKRSGAMVATMGDEIIFAGGSNPAVFATGAYNLTDAFSSLTNTWRSLASMNRGRQVTGAFINNSGLYVVSGSGGTGGSPTLKSMEVFFLRDSLPPAGDAVSAGKLTPAGASFNFGIVQAGQVSQQQLTLTHSSGNQGVLISGLKVVGDTAFKVVSPVAAPYLVRPGETSMVGLSFASKGAIPAETYLEISFAVPPGATLKVPLEANRTVSTMPGSRSREASTHAGKYWDGMWKFGSHPAKDASHGADLVPVYRNALGRIR